MKRKCPVCNECLDYRVDSKGDPEFICYLCGKKYSHDLAKGLVEKQWKKEEGNTSSLLFQA